MKLLRLPKRTACFIVVMAIMLAPGIASADVLYSYGFNARGIAMGGAAAAQVKDFGVAYYNPAGGVLFEFPTAGVGYMKTGNWLETHHGEPAALDSTEGMLFGTILPLPLGSWLERRLAVGFATFMPNNIFVALDVPYGSVPQYALWRNSGRQMTILPTLSIRLHDAVAIGGGAQLFSNTNGEINAVIGANDDVQTLTGQEVTTSFAPTYGLMLRPGKIWESLTGWSFGFVFREEFWMHYRIPINTFLGSTPLTMIFDATSIYTPRQWTAGVSYENEAAGFLAELDASYNEWRKFPDPNLYVDVEFTVPLLDIVFQDSEEIDPEFHDTMTFRAGVEKRVYDTDTTGLVAQLGYYYDPSPVPPQTGSTNYLDTDRHVGSTGLGFQWDRIGSYRFAGPLTIQGFYQLHYCVPRMFYKNESVSADNPGYPKIDVGGWIWAAGINVSVFFEYDAE